MMQGWRRPHQTPCRLLTDHVSFLDAKTCRRYSIGSQDDSHKKGTVWLENRRTSKWLKMIGKQLEDWEV